QARLRNNWRDAKSNTANTIGSNTNPVLTSGTAGGGLCDGGQWGGKIGKWIPIALLPLADLFSTIAVTATVNPVADVIIQPRLLASRDIMLPILSFFLRQCQ
ncbi:MAG: hypothetical protein WAM44_14890, partial [Chthoniobacterales bacterium]